MGKCFLPAVNWINMASQDEAELVMCFCSDCTPGKHITRRRVQAHLNQDQTMLADLESQLESPGLCHFIKQCIQRTLTGLYGERLTASQIYSIFVLKSSYSFSECTGCDAIDGSPNPQPEESFSDFMLIDDFFDDPIVPNPPGQSSSPSLAISASLHQEFLELLWSPTKCFIVL